MRFQGASGVHEFSRKLVGSSDDRTQAQPPIRCVARRSRCEPWAQHVSALFDRFQSNAGLQLLKELHIEPGTLADYHALSAFHYRGRQPGAATSVLRIVHRTPTVIGRYISRPAVDSIAGVLVRCLPSLGCELRQVATNGRYAGLARHDSAALLNAEIRTIARVVIEPRYRGLGLAVKLVRHALDHPEHDSIRLTEALAAMGRVSPFFERAGMKRYDRPPRPQDARLREALAHLGIEPITLASHAATHAQLQRLTSAQTQFLEFELARWQRHQARRAAAKRPAAQRRTAQRRSEGCPPGLERCPPDKRCCEMSWSVERSCDSSLESRLTAARNALLSQPVYYAHLHNLTRARSSAADGAGPSDHRDFPAACAHAVTNV